MFKFGIARSGPTAKRFSPTVVLFPAVPEARTIIALSQTRLSALQCLVALRRYELAHKKLPATLEEAVREAGLDAVPLDPHSGEPLKYVVRDGKPIVYSVGSDQVDDQARRDWKFGEQPGDFIFRMGM